MIQKPEAPSRFFIYAIVPLNAGADEISQECLLLGKSILAGPL